MVPRLHFLPVESGKLSSSFVFFGGPASATAAVNSMTRADGSGGVYYQMPAGRMLSYILKK